MATKNTKSKVKKKPAKTAVGNKSKKAKPFETYDESLNYLFTMTDYEKQRMIRYNVTTFDLTRMYELLGELGNPHEKLKAVHIAGTKGKGSTSTMVARMLEANGYNVGLYTSPHITSLHERIAINSCHMSKEDMVALVNTVRPAVDKLTENGRKPTFFELFTAMAFVHFVNNGVDFAVLETGLGGRLDSTNVVTPVVSAITSISIDHQRQLGKTLDRIASEKAGIIKKGVPVVTVVQEEESLNVIKAKALEANAPIKIVGEDVDFSCRFEASREDGPHTRICVLTPTSKFEHLKVPLPGEHQAMNCGLALVVLDCLKNLGFEIDDEKSVEGLGMVRMPGRLQVVYNNPRVVVDMAHNAASIKALIQTIGQHIPYDSMVMIFGCNADKDIVGMLDELQYGADKVIFTRSSSPRAVRPDELAEMYSEQSNRMCQTALSLGDALKIAKSAVTREDVICITGSVYLVGDAIKRFNKIREQEAKAAAAAAK
ncbi:MAG: bifunctional folylpolyglutamate synthase/dihydrofolate synthase [Sedimentisphaeraceae bacterium JB056]